MRLRVMMVMLLAAPLHSALAGGSPKFPLKVSENQRHLVDQAGRPFLIHGDSPWEIIWQLKREEATEYLDHRVAQGFNTVLVNLIPDKVSGNNHPWTKNRYGVQVFRDPNDFTTAVPEYFDHAEWFVREAGERGLLVLLFPCYLGADTTWIDDLHANGVEKARAYGRFVAERFAKYPNLIWVMGGDRDPEYALAEHDALAEAIRTHDPKHLMTFHGSVHSSSTLYHNAPWLDLNMSYNYRETYVQSHEDYHRTPVKPTFLSESGYEREANDSRYGTPQRMRRQAYWTLLAGSCGHLYGSSFWHLGPGWRDSLDWPGVRQMRHVRDLFEPLPWHQLVPQFEKELILAGQGEYGSREDYITAAATPDRGIAVLYMPIARRVKLNLGLFPGPVHARWLDPTNGIYSEAGDKALPNRGEHWLNPPARECDSDWVLLLESAGGQSQTNGKTVLGVERTRFTLNGQPAFLLGISYYAGLGASEDFIRRDLDDVQRYGFNWLRVWATWNQFDNDVSAVDAHGRAREPFVGKLQRLVAECDRRGLIMDVTLTRDKDGLLPDYEAHRHAVETLVEALKAHRNWYLDLANERDVLDGRYVSAEELRQLRDRVRQLDPQRLVTASGGGANLSAADVREHMLTAGIDFLSPHRLRWPGSPGQTEAKTRECLDCMKELGCVAPVHYQEPFRRGYDQWEPTAADFLTDLRGAVAGGAAGWCFHNGTQRSAPDQQPRRSFDLRDRRLFDQLDSEERKVVAEAAASVRLGQSKEMTK